MIIELVDCQVDQWVDSHLLQAHWCISSGEDSRKRLGQHNDFDLRLNEGPTS